MSTIAAPRPALALAPKVVLAEGAIALVATDGQDCLVRPGSQVTIDGQARRVDAIVGAKGNWTVELA